MEKVFGAEGFGCVPRVASCVAEGHGDVISEWPVRSQPLHRGLRNANLHHPPAVPSVSASAAVAGIAVPVPSLSAASWRITFAAVTPNPRCASGGVVYHHGGRRVAGAHFPGLQNGASLPATSEFPRLSSSAVRVPSVASEKGGRLAFAAAICRAGGGEVVRACAGGLLPSVAASPVLGASRLQLPQPNMAVEGTLRLVASFNRRAVALAASLSLAAVVAARPSPLRWAS